MASDLSPSSSQTINVPSRLPRIPFELHRPIIELMHPNTFRFSTHSRYYHELSLVCRDWRREVERTLYQDVRVPDGNIMLFCRTMLSRPDLALLVERLIVFAGAPELVREGDKPIVEGTLRSLKSLKDFEIMASANWGGDLPLTEKWIISPDDCWMLDDCTFDLVSLTTPWAWTPRLVETLAKQPHLREFIHRGGSASEIEVDVPDSVLAHCNIIHADSRILFGMQSSFRNITHMSLKFHKMGAAEEFTAAESIKRVGFNLVSLQINRRVEEDYASTTSLLRIFTPNTPNLLFLALYETFDYSPRENAQMMKIISKNLRKLQCFVWAPLSEVSPFDEFDSDEEDDEEGSRWSIDTDESDEEDQKTSYEKTSRYAQAFFTACASLQLFISGRGGRTDCWRVLDRPTGQLATMEKEDRVIIDPSTTAFRYIDSEAPLDYLLYGKVREPRFSPQDGLISQLPPRPRMDWCFFHVDILTTHSYSYSYPQRDKFDD